MGIQNTNQVRIVVAVAVASIVVLPVGLVCGMLDEGGWWTVSKGQADLTDLARLPVQIGEWKGDDIPLDDRIMRATGGGVHLNRRYSRNNGAESVSLYVVVGTGVEQIMSHRPLGCYRSAGWLLVGNRSMDLPLEDGRTLPCIVYQFARIDGLRSERVTVLHYCYAEGKLYDEVMKVMASRWRGLRALRSAAQVQVVSQCESLSDDSNMEIVVQFAIDSAVAVLDQFADLDAGDKTHKSSGVLDGQ
ncbi:MAG TPA: exosortase-associated EpsI family protein [Sedimentisphaerales bacterium]|nr:exosortase-associated EpsI family protein [Sedimentisphaerales bacterium]